MPHPSTRKQNLKVSWKTVLQSKGGSEGCWLYCICVFKAPETVKAESLPAEWKGASGRSSLLPRTWVQMLLDNSNQRVFSLAFKMAGMINYMNNFGSLSKRGWYLPAHICSYAYLIPAKRSRQEVEPGTSQALQKWHSILGAWIGETDERTNSSVSQRPCKREDWSCHF